MKEVLKVNVSEVPTYAKLAYKSGNNLLIVSDPGCGKSTVVLGMEGNDCKVTMFTGSSTYEETVNGIPYKTEDGVQKYTKPSWLIEMNEWSKTHPNGMNVLFLDEFNTADKVVMDTFKTILTERKVPTQTELNIPNNTVVIAAMNPQEQNQGSEFDRAHASRFMVIGVESNLDTYRKFIKGESNTRNGLEVLDEPNSMTVEQKEAILDQISDADFANYREGDYHEINARSLSNFFKACEYLQNPSTDVKKVSKAFFGMCFEWKENIERKIEQRKEKIRNMSVYPTEAELNDFSDEELIEYKKRIVEQYSMSAIKCKATIMKLLKKRGLNDSEGQGE